VRMVSTALVKLDSGSAVAAGAVAIATLRNEIATR
jgi:hypothetical protein